MSLEPVPDENVTKATPLTLPFPNAVWLRVLYGLFVGLMPVFSFWATDLLKPEWQNGDIGSYIILLLFPQASVWFLRNELDGLQFRPRCETAWLYWSARRVFHVSPSRNGRRASRSVRSGQFQVRDHGERNHVADFRLTPTASPLLIAECLSAYSLTAQRREV